MCLIVFAWQVVPGLPLVAAANRDEYYARPALPAGLWEDQPDIYAGLVRELRKLGVTTVVDTDGEPLRHAVRAEPDVISPNVRDFLARTPRPVIEKPFELSMLAQVMERVVEAG